MFVRERLSACVATGLWGNQRQQEDIAIEAERAIVGVIEIMLDTLLHRFIGTGFTAEPIDLRPSGDARLDVPAPRIKLDPALEKAIMGDGVRARPDKRHFAFQNIDELGEFIERSPPQEAPDGSNATIVLGHLNDDIAIVQGRHGAKFPDPKFFGVMSATPLAEKHRPTTIELDQ